MPSDTSRVENILDEMWASHRDFLRRLLIGLTHDMDLTDDLLQETYLRARKGVDGYRGGDARAWLGTIARNAFYSDIRRRYVRNEVPLDAERVAADDLVVDPILLADLRRATSDLSPILRTALVMRHYGGYSYEEIAGRLGCPVGTAKRRVSVALRRLRQALGAQEELVRMQCSEITDRRLMDLVCGKPLQADAESLRNHLAQCASCGGRADEIGRVLTALDSVESDWKMSAITELDENGIPKSYICMSIPNVSDEPMDTIELGSSSRSGPSHVLVQGEEAAVEALPGKPAAEGRKYRVHLPRRFSPGERIGMLLVVEDDRPLSGEPVVVKLNGDVWRFGPGRIHLTEELVYVTAVRLPCGACLIDANPQPSEVRSNGATTVVWRNVLPPDTEFEFWVEYRLSKA